MVDTTRLALIVIPSVTCLAVYRWLQIYLSWVWACNLSCLSHIFKCLYSIALETTSTSHVYFQPCASAQQIGLWRLHSVTSNGLRGRNLTNSSCGETLSYLNLSPKIFPDGPAAIQLTTVIRSCATQDACASLDCSGTIQKILMREISAPEAVRRGQMDPSQAKCLCWRKRLKVHGS